ncbi:MAG: pseudouridine synthase [Treponemataceae bacterium]
MKKSGIKMEKECKILYENKNFLICFKPNGIPSAPISENDQKSLLYYISLSYPEVLCVQNGLKTVEGGLVHRIDTETSGIVLIARNTDFWNYMYKIQKNGCFEKYYLAYCEKLSDRYFSKNSNIFEEDIYIKGFPTCKYEMKVGQKIQSKFRNYGVKRKSVRPVELSEVGTYAEKKAFNKIYCTKIESFEKESFSNDIYNSVFKNSKKNCYKIKCSLTQGFRHQVRCHLSWLGYPVINDSIYNPFCTEKNDPMLFFASALKFPDIGDGKLLFFDFSDQIKRTAN